MIKFRTRKEAEECLRYIQCVHDSMKDSEVYEFDNDKESFYFISEGEEVEWDDDLDSYIVKELNDVSSRVYCEIDGGY